MKKRFLELLIKQAGFIPQQIECYKTDSCDGQFEVKTGWKGRGIDLNGDVVIQFETPEGFNDAVAEIMKQIYRLDGVKIRTDRELKV